MDELERLIRLFPLPEPWGVPELFIGQGLAGTSAFPLVGIAVQPSASQLITGSAGGEDAVTRAYFELIERISTVDSEKSGLSTYRALDAQGVARESVPRDSVFPQNIEGASWRYAKSNGVAVSLESERARRSALFEVIERDRVLSSWFGESAPVALSLGPSPLLQQCSTTHEIRMARFADYGDLATVGVFLFPREEYRNDQPLAYGFACRGSQEAALEAATAECLQRLGFLQGETLSDVAPEVSASPDFHQDWYLVPAHHEMLRRWLDGAHGSRPTQRSPRVADARYIDLTPPHLEGKLTVVKALVPEALPLCFGLYEPYAEPSARISLIHPIA